MLKKAIEIFNSPNKYNLFGNQCDNMSSEILSAGNHGYHVKAWPNTSYDSFKENKTHWSNQNGINRGTTI